MMLFYLAGLIVTWIIFLVRFIADQQTVTLSDLIGMTIVSLFASIFWPLAIIAVGIPKFFTWADKIIIFRK